MFGRRKSSEITLEVTVREDGSGSVRVSAALRVPPDHVAEIGKTLRAVADQLAGEVRVAGERLTRERIEDDTGDVARGAGTPG